MCTGLLNKREPWTEQCFIFIMLPYVYAYFFFVDAGKFLLLA